MNEKRLTREEKIAKIFNNVAISMLPSPLNTLINTLQNINTEEELLENFAEIKENIEKLKTSIPIIPISVEIKMVSSVIIYIDIQLDNDTINTLEEQLNLKRTDSLYDYGVDDIIVTTNNVSFNLFDLTEKSELDELIESVEKILQDYNINIKSIVYI